METFDVKYILRKGGCTKIRYSVRPVDAEPEESIISRADTPHEDFRRLWAKLPAVAARMLEFPLSNADGKNLVLRVTKVNFLEHKDYGYGMQLIVLVDGLANCSVPLQIVTHKFYCNPVEFRDKGKKKIPLQSLESDEKMLMEALKQEAFEYAYHGKRQQPTLDEAQDAYERGGFPDEKH